IQLDVPKGLLVKETTGAVQQAGMKAGDLITAVNGGKVYTFGDLQHFYDKTPRTASTAMFTVERDGAAKDLTVNLPIRWWWSDQRYRQSSVDPRIYFDARPLTDEEKSQLKL